MKKFVLAVSKKDWLMQRLADRGYQYDLKFYLKQFYLDLNSKKCVTLANKAITEMTLRSAGTIALTAAIRGKTSIFLPIKKPTNPLKVISASNLKLILELFESIGMKKDLIQYNVSFILSGLYKLSIALLNKTPMLSEEYKAQPKQVLADYIAFIILGTEAKIKIPKVASVLRPYYTKPDSFAPDLFKGQDGTDPATTGVKDKHSRLGTFGLTFDLEGLKANPRDPFYVRVEVSEILRKYRMLLKKTDAKEKFKVELYGTTKPKAPKNSYWKMENLYTGIKSFEHEYPLTHFPQFAEQVGGTEIAKFLILTSERMVTNLRNIRIYGKQKQVIYHLQTKIDPNIDKLKEFYRNIDYNQFKPEPWMLHYATIKDLRLYETLYKLVSNKEAPVLDKDPVSIIHLLSGSKLQDRLDKTVLTPEQYEELTDKDLIKIMNLDEDLLFNRLCKNCITPEFKRSFLSARLMSEYKKFKSSFGKISTRDAKIILEDDYLPLLPLKVAVKWDQKTTPWKKQVEPFLPKNLEEKIKVETEVSDISAIENSLKKFLSHSHGVTLEVLKVWKIQIKDELRRHLVNNASDPEINIIKDGFHGTATSAAGSILMSGFKLKGTMRTGRSMGDVLYIAPNIDKSLQYIGGSFGRADATGIIFHGDLLVKGAPTSSARDTRGKGNWTLTNGFSTQEIGLVDANMQYLLHHAYLVRRVRDNSAKKNTAIPERTKFKAKIELSAYLLDKGILGDRSTTPIEKLKRLREKRAAK
jgi:hypothetical protein